MPKSRTVHVAITRPAGSARSLAAAVRRCGAIPLLLPALSLRNVDDTRGAGAALGAGLSADIVVFTSPAAVAFAHKLRRLQPARSTEVIAVGVGTAAALHRRGIKAASTPTRQDSEGVLALEVLHSIAGREVAVIGAEGGRGLLQRTLRARGARVADVHVYQRVAARLDRRHLQPLRSVPGPLYVLVSSVRTLHGLRTLLRESDWARIRDATIVASSARVQRAASAAGCRAIVRARSAAGADLLAAVVAKAQI